MKSINFEPTDLAKSIFFKTKFTDLFLMFLLFEAIFITKFLFFNGGKKLCIKIFFLKFFLIIFL